MNLFVIEKHDQLLHIWRDHSVQDLRISHFDFHCDMRGMLIDRKKQRAYRILDLLTIFELDSGVDIGNFLTYAVMEQRVSEIRWIHRTPGGRDDDVGTVKYSTDITVQPMWQLMKLWRKSGVPLQYDVHSPKDWPGLKPNDFLDIDWDYFAGLEYPPETIPDAIEEFFALDFANSPSGISVCFSPDFSYPDRTLFESFIHRLAKRFDADIVRIPLPQDYFQYKEFVIPLLPQKPQKFANRVYQKFFRAFDMTYDRVTRKLHHLHIH